MINLLKRLWTALLYDEAMAQRLLAAALFGIGTLFAGGGAIPGTETVIPGLKDLFWLGDPLKLAGIYLGAGGKLTLAPAPEKPADPKP